jgi:hypothetical protein
MFMIERNDNVRELAMKTLVFALAMLAATTALGTRAEAQNYPWCALYSGGSMGGGRNCGFTTFDQCLATISGIGGTCMQNTMYEPPAGAAPHHRQRVKHYTNG